jgi:excisionase family DNA binding protein
MQDRIEVEGHTYYDATYLATLFGVGDYTVKNWVRKKGLPVMRIGRWWFFDMEKVMEWSAQRGARQRE